MPSPDQVNLNLFDKFQLGLMRLAIVLLRFLGFRGIRFLGGILGRLAWLCVPSRRRYATEAVRSHLGVSADKAKAIAAASFRHNICSFMETPLTQSFRLHHNRNLLPFDKYADMLVHETRPVVVAAAHIGGWELLPGLVPDVKPGTPKAMVVRNQPNKALNHLIYDMRGSSGGEVVGHYNAAPTVSRILRQKGATAFLVDHNARRREGIFIDFLGEPASVNMGPAMLALRAKAVVYPVFLIRRPKYMYELITRPPLDTATLEGSISERVRQIAEFYTKAVEDIVREYPEQWMWMHERWKRKPQKQEEEKA